MPFFGKKADDAEHEPDREPLCALSEDQVLNVLAYEVARSTRYGRTLSVLRIVPHTLPGEAIQTAEVAAICEAASHQLRDVDRLGMLGDHTLLAVLPETNGAAARVIAQRLATDLTIRAAGGKQRNWLVGSSTLWEDGEAAQGLLVAAHAHAIRRTA